MIISTTEEREHLSHIGMIVATVLNKMLNAVSVGQTTKELDMYGKELLLHFGATSAPHKDYNFPGFTCISVNNEVAHGIPSEKIICAGDIVNIDVSAEKNGFYADTGGTIVLEPKPSEHIRLIETTKTALYKAISVATAGANLNVIGKAIESVAKEHGYRLVENLCSHGIGRKLHEEPSEILGFYAPNERRILKENMVITIEPFLSTDSRLASEGKDGWTLIGNKGGFSAQFEHTMIITKDTPIILTSLEPHIPNSF